MFKIAQNGTGLIIKNKLSILTKITLNNSRIMLQSSSHHVSIDFELFPKKTFINGKWHESVNKSSEKTFDIHDPATNKLLGTLPDCSIEDLDVAIQAADSAFKTWKDCTAEHRSRVLRKLAELHVKHKQHLAEIITYENGKPMRDALVEIEVAGKAYEWFSEEAKRVYGDIIPSPALNKKFFVVKQPVGVCGFITPWNFPSSMIARKTAAALAAGCTVVIKPSEDTPYSALALCQLAEKAGLPPGCLNVVTTSRASTPALGKHLCEHSLVKKISFTGSTPVGKILLANCASTVKRVQMELGGNAPFIIFDSADLNKAVSGLVSCKFRCSGQTCICANRILVQENIHDKFIEALAAAMKRDLRVGNGFDNNTTQGPLINEAAVKKVQGLIDDSVSKGGKVIIGGKPCTTSKVGNFYEPTIISHVNTTMKIAREEIFGPVASIIKFKTEEEALAIANSVDVGLAGYFYSQDISQVWRVAEKLQVGMVGVNEAVISTIEAPFGGVKQSGFGYEGSKYGINEYLHNKYVCMGI